MGIAKLRPPSYCVMPYQAFEAEGFEQDLPRNEIKDTMRDCVFQFKYTFKCRDYREYGEMLGFGNGGP